MLYRLDASQVANGVKNREFSAEEYIHQVLERIEVVEPKINALVTVNNKGAIEQARALDKKIRDGKAAGPLSGVAISVKDNISTKGIRTTCASKMLDSYVPPYDATVVKRLQDAGAIIIGKANLDEFAMGSTTEFSRNGPTRNPWDISRVPGGSSGGSAASVAAMECAISLGSDTGGSVRCPASFCSVVGLKPTYGLVSRYGLISYANSLEQVGPAGRTVADVAAALNAIVGQDENDHTTAPGKPSYLVSKMPLRVGLVKEFIEGADPEVSRIIYRAYDTLEKEGCRCAEVSMPSAQYALASYYTIAMAEASSNLARYDNVRYGFDMSPDGYEWNSYFAKGRSNFGEEVKRRIITGSYVLSSGYYGKYYLKAQQVRSLLRRELKSLFRQFDVLIGPTMPILPFPIGEKVDDPLKMYLVDVDTVVANLAGIPAISVPAGFSGDNLPVGLQIMADEFSEQVMLDAAYTFESAAKVQRSPDL
ncbi:Asp-tRNA(Asn)/Glu-tRNA(Gln) amidotransferase subunit GatA [Nitrososphaera viennensis]|uniref:Glutamyl-tRNA(Gln) amidotransferase subunit A n=2 Tax=Nitrososphaera viennensis TaxID=1034015 RepID=A0A060HQ21_9ARCH|nr:Asp-tRNA(Asn)/Glu-tRNA(Gln) amidotransferase subunit GatA [Nitrososphaera viennensis]AIC15651.1 glutamyl-tRNA amidotransferase subunit A [Nitrososphaera viennensis EN76]UVS70525.1 Asp-tRNA(Asn)/Glu-tRNA(Gln) amidotransferase subunit GatA [Nitrososphaera viennensis]